jgi:hypothetical protein
MSKAERKYLVKVCKHGGITPQHRKFLWLRATGAISSMNLPENKDYYKRLKNIGIDYPSPSSH